MSKVLTAPVTGHCISVSFRVSSAGQQRVRADTDSADFAMLSFLTGNLFESPAQTLVNTVNTEGVMGKGIALQFKKYFPEMFAEYQDLCEQGKFRIGSLHIYRTPHRNIINFPTKTTWRKPSRLEYIELGLQTFVSHYQVLGIHSVAFPPLGCGNGELAYDDVRPLMERYLHGLPIPVFLYPPLPRTEVAEHRAPATVRAWLRSDPRAMPFREFRRDLEDLLRRPRQFRTLTKGTPFIAELGDDGHGLFIRVRAAGKISAYHVEDLKTVWSLLRGHGIVTSHSIDARHSAHLFPILAALPYMERVRIANSFDNLQHTPFWALQIVASEPQGTGQAALAL
jgi:O-acetyl-ADP-ribose deacetylase (regulator of RNase III)